MLSCGRLSSQRCAMATHALYSTSAPPSAAKRKEAVDFKSLVKNAVTGRNRDVMKT